MGHVSWSSYSESWHSQNSLLAKNADPDKYVYDGYGIGFDSRSLFLLPNYNWSKNLIIFGVDMRKIIS